MSFIEDFVRAWRAATTLDDAPVEVVDPNVVKIDLPVDGKEIFTPPLLNGRVYQITIEGVYQYRKNWIDIVCDGGYTGDRHGNLTIPHDRLIVAGVIARSMIVVDNWHENRAQNRYWLQIEGNGSEVSLTFTGIDWTPARTALHATLQLLPAETPSLTARIRRVLQERAADEGRLQRERDDADRRAAEVAEAQAIAAKDAEAQKSAAETQAQRQQQLDARIAELRILVRAHSNFLDQSFREFFVRANRDQLIGELGAEWRQEYDSLYREDSLVVALSERAPDVMDFFEKKLSMVLDAERAVVTPPEPAAEPSKPEEPPVDLEIPVDITEKTITIIEGLIGEQFDLRHEYDQTRKMEHVPATRPATQATLAHIKARMHLNFQILKRYRIDAETPEDAFQQFRTLWTCTPAKSLYEQIAENPDATGLDILARRVRDLHHDQAGLIRHRVDANRRRDWQKQRELDERLENVRHEFGRWVRVLQAHNHPIDLPKRETEESVGDQAIRIWEEMREVTAKVRLHDTRMADSMESLYEEQIARILRPDDQTYT